MVEGKTFLAVMVRLGRHPGVEELCSVQKNFIGAGVTRLLTAMIASDSCFISCTAGQAASPDVFLVTNRQSVKSSLLADTK